MHEMALGGTTANPHYGAVRNPWNPGRIPGGSSGGAGACVSLQIGYAALGTDSAGSVRMPAGFCGIVGLKPTHGLVSMKGLVPTGVYNSDHIGPMTRTVADAALMLSVMAGYDPADPDSTRRGPDPYQAPQDLTGVKAGVPENYFWEGIDTEVDRVCRQAVKLMQDAGAEIVPLRLETIHLVPLIRSALFAEAFVFHETYIRAHPELYGDDVRDRLLACQYVLATDYVRAARARTLLLDELTKVLATVDVLATPVMMAAAPVMGAFTVKIGDDEIPFSGAGGISFFVRNTAPFNLTGQPAISIPAGLTADGLPVGLQLASRAFGEHKLTAIAGVTERLIGFDTTPPALRGA
jgi:aspartyl-tRNA(Asn)/glutamyl-tRNA(Gln) amidotransferase subunit A